MEQKIRERTDELIIANQQLEREIVERLRAEKERERLLAQIQEQAQHMQQIVDTAPEGMLLLDTDRHIMLINPVAQKHLSALTDSRVGDPLTRLGKRPLAELLTSPPKGLWHEVSTEHQDFQVIARPIETGPTPSGWVLVIRDVTGSENWTTVFNNESAWLPQANWQPESPTILTTLWRRLSCMPR